MTYRGSLVGLFFCPKPRLLWLRKTQTLQPFGAGWSHVPEKLHSGDSVATVSTFPQAVRRYSVTESEDTNMKKLLTSLLLAGSLALTGCGSSNNDFTTGNGGGNQNPPVVQGYFVNSATGNDATGAFATGSRFATIQAALAAAPAGSDIIIEPGTYPGAVNNVENGDRLLGSESTLLMGTATTRPVLTSPITLADGNTVDFLRIQNTATTAIDGEQQNGGTVSNCEIATVTNGSGVSIFQSRGSWTVSNNTITGTAGAQTFGVKVSTNGANTAVYRITDNSISGNQGGIGFLAGDTSTVNALTRANTLMNNGTVGFELIVGNDSTFCLDLESNNSNNPYVISESITPGSVLRIEQLGNLNAPRPGGAANVGTINILAGALVQAPTAANDGDCGPF